MDPVHVPSIPAASFLLPPRLEGLRRLAYNLHWAWHPRTRGLFTGSTDGLDPLPEPDPGHQRPDRLVRGCSTTGVLQALDCMPCTASVISLPSSWA